MIGILTGVAGQIAPTDIMRKSILLKGIYVGPRQMFEAMNRAIVERHGGRFRAEPGEGRGAVFLFRQPRPSIASEVEDDDAPRTIKQTGLGAQIMSTMGVTELVLLTDSPSTRYLGLDAYGISIVGTRPLSEG